MASPQFAPGPSAFPGLQQGLSSCRPRLPASSWPWNSCACARLHTSPTSTSYAHAMCILTGTCAQHASHILIHSRPCLHTTCQLTRSAGGRTSTRQWQGLKALPWLHEKFIYWGLGGSKEWAPDIVCPQPVADCAANGRELGLLMRAQRRARDTAPKMDIPAIPERHTRC